MTSSTVDVCIVGYGTPELLAGAIASASAIPNASVAFVEHSSDPSSVDVASRAAHDLGLAIRTTHDPSNPGFGAGVNGLVSGSQADWLVFLNPDAVIVNWPWTESAMPAQDEIVGAAQRLPDFTPIRAWGRRYRTRDEVLRSWFRRSPLPRDGVGFVGGGALVIHREAFNRLGGFDERYFLFYEDIDLCMRAGELGYRVRVEPAWTVRHALGSSTRRDWRAALQASYRSGRLFHESHGHSLLFYDLFVAVDSLGRSVMRVALGQRDHAAADRAIFSTAVRHIFRRPLTPWAGHRR